MATLRSHIRVQRAADEVYALVADSDRLTEWFPGVESVKLEGDRRTCGLPGGASVVEEIVTDDPKLRRFQYRITEGMPATFHLSTVDVIESSDDESLVVYAAEIEPNELAPLMAPALEAALAGLKARLEA